MYCEDTNVATRLDVTNSNRNKLRVKHYFFIVLGLIILKAFKKFKATKCPRCTWLQSNRYKSELLPILARGNVRMMETVTVSRAQKSQVANKTL